MKEQNKELSALVEKIKEKKELASLDDNYVAEQIKQSLNKETKEKFLSLSNKQFFRTKEFDNLRSVVRKRLRETYGVFSHEHINKEELLTRLVNEDQELVVRQLLNLHQSTQERIPFYTSFYKKLFSITGCHPKIFDIGCGLNPISYQFMNCNARYLCCDISSSDVDFLNKFFSTTGVDGCAYAIDAINRDAIQELVEKESPQIVFLFKVADTLETLERHSSKKLVALLLESVQFVVVSFPTVSLGGNKAIHENRRSWFEKFLEKSEYTYETFEIPNEKVYVVKQ